MNLPPIVGFNINWLFPECSCFVFVGFQQRKKLFLQVGDNSLSDGLLRVPAEQAQRPSTIKRRIDSAKSKSKNATAQKH